MLCGLHHKRVEHSALGIDHSSWQVHRISKTKKKKKNDFSSGGVVRGAAEFRVFLMSDKYDRRYVSVHVACGFTLGGTSKPVPLLAARNSSSMHGAIPDGGCLLSSKLPQAAE